MKSEQDDPIGHDEPSDAASAAVGAGSSVEAPLDGPYAEVVAMLEGESWTTHYVTRGAVTQCGCSKVHKVMLDVDAAVPLSTKQLLAALLGGTCWTGGGQQ